MKGIIVALCLALTTASEPSYYSGREFNIEDFTKTEPRIGEDYARQLAIKQPECYLYNDSCYAFVNFGKFECNNDNNKKEDLKKYPNVVRKEYPNQMINEYPSPEEEKYSNERDITTIQTNKPVPEIYKECTGKYCSWFVEYAYSKCSGYVKLYIPFRVCSSECGRDNNNIHTTCGSYTGYGKCSCQTVFCVKSIFTAYYDKDYVLRKGYLEYKFPCKCGCRNQE